MAKSPNLKQSYALCKKITLGHYENFPVSSLLVQKHLRYPIFAIYAFARTADDAADENPDKEEAIEILTNLRKRLNSPYELPESENTFFPALHDTIKQFDLPIKYFNDLLNAFEYDVTHKIFPTDTDMMNYCQNSAVPVGRVVLALHGLHKESLLKYSDKITTALQLANFWQDVSEDFKKNRIYIPQKKLEKFNLYKDDFSKQNKPEEKKTLIRELVRDTLQMFNEGKPLLKYLPFRLKQEIRLTISGGMSILKKTEELGERAFSIRPKLSKWDWIKIIAGG